MVLVFVALSWLILVPTEANKHELKTSPLCKYNEPASIFSWLDSQSFIAAISSEGGGRCFAGWRTCVSNGILIWPQTMQQKSYRDAESCFTDAQLNMPTTTDLGVPPRLIQYPEFSPVGTGVPEWVTHRFWHEKKAWHDHNQTICHRQLHLSNCIQETLPTVSIQWSYLSSWNLHFCWHHQWSSLVCHRRWRQRWPSWPIAWQQLKLGLLQWKLW